MYLDVYISGFIWDFYIFPIFCKSNYIGFAWVCKVLPERGSHFSVRTTRTLDSVANRWWKHILPLVDIMGHSEFNDQWGKFMKIQALANNQRRKTITKAFKSLLTVLSSSNRHCYCPLYKQIKKILKKKHKKKLKNLSSPLRLAFCCSVSLRALCNFRCWWSLRSCILQRPPQISVIVIPWNIPMKYPHHSNPKKQ